MQLLPWPAKSPDITLMENVWQYIKNQLNFDQSGPSATRHELILRVEEVWQQIASDYLQKLYQSMPKRLAAFQAMPGCPTKY